MPLTHCMLSMIHEKLLLHVFLLFTCCFSPSKQVRDQLVANLPSTPDPTAPEPVIVNSPPSNAHSPWQPSRSNVYPSLDQSPITGLSTRAAVDKATSLGFNQTRSGTNPYWNRGMMPQRIHPNSPFTASMQRQQQHTVLRGGGGGSGGSDNMRHTAMLSYRHTNPAHPRRYPRWNQSDSNDQPKTPAPQTRPVEYDDNPSTIVDSEHKPVLSNADMANTNQTPSPSSDTSADSFVGSDGKLRMTICDHPNGFLRRQQKLCRRYLHLMESVVRGYFMGLRECEYQFSSHRWNCQGHNVTLRVPPRRRRRSRYRQTLTKRDSLNAKPKPMRITTYLDKLLSKGTRESAFVLAVTSAGVSHAVTKACSSGLHDNCGCDRTIYDHPREPSFEWFGCSDNIHFGAAFSRQFLDVRERSRLKRKPKLGMTNLHNNHVGRQSVINKMEVQCKCHGVSGSCEMRTCWRSLPKFRQLGVHLQQRFREALLVDYMDKQLVPIKQHGASSPPPPTDMASRLNPFSAQRRNRFVRESGAMKVLDSTAAPASSAPTENDLLYIKDSPTFCHHDPRYGSIGTYGRRCEENVEGLNSCDYLCCGRGFKRETFVQEERCNCRFQWCCKVTCQTCRKTVVVSTCN